MKSVETDNARLHFQWLTILINALSEIDTNLEEEKLPNATQAGMLLLLGSYSNGVRIGHLAKELHLRPNTTTAAINILEEDSLITRLKTRDDRRGTTLVLTDAGRGALDRIYTLVEKYFDNKHEIVDALIDKDSLPEEVNAGDKRAIYCLVFQEARRLVLDFTAFAKPHSVNLSSLRVLTHVGLNKARQRMIDISYDLNMHQNVLSISAKRLIDHKYIAKKVDSTDKRAIILSTLPKGRKVVKAAIEEMAALSKSSLLSLDSSIPE